MEPVAVGGEEPGLLTETFWACLHGLATPVRSGRLPLDAQERRLALLIRRFAVDRTTGARQLKAGSEAG